MSHNTRESLSALMDSESDELELRRVLKSLPDDTDAADAWRRYHLARSLMQREQGVDVSVDLSAGIMAQLHADPVPLPSEAQEAGRSVQKRPRISFLRGASVAAAVSLMVVTGVQYLDQDTHSQTADNPSSIASTPSLPDNTAQRVQPVSLEAFEPSGVGTMRPDVPVFESTPFQLNGQYGNGGIMNVSEGRTSSSFFQPRTMTPARSTSLDSGQVRQLRSYLEQHAHGAAYGNSDSWSPLTRSVTATELLGQ